ncbi:MAG: LPS assembly lipoprotein LptE [Thiohalophilus sp.]|uniref:LPS-assembly lipoprotein LptE n=1 Tax=Thiohalophilus sp. TaxID=3028392 RepID=UPI0028707558|nr:LPS assembly lipoprotein LptE [Thiohalophilus sp.]MDR9435950.1 LPS assembly lipoprotein LptE [Thiohalophilus sp.]
MSMTRYWLPLLLILALALQACGFRLRGAVDMPPELQYTVAEGVAPYSALGESLSRSWRLSNARLDFEREAVGSSAARLVINGEDVTRRTLSVDSAGRPNEYELRYQVRFTLEDAGGQPLLQNQNITVSRAYQFDPNNALAMDDEEARLERLLAEEAALQMMRRITFQLRHRAAQPAPEGEEPAPAFEAGNGADDETAR